MRLTILAVGRLKAGPERILYDRYAERIAAAGRSVSITLAARELAESRAGSAAAARVAEETAALAAAAPDGAPLVVLDWHRQIPDQPGFRGPDRALARRRRTRRCLGDRRTRRPRRGPWSTAPS